MDEALVSIIIPMYNSKEWIERLLTSIHQQTYKNLEVVLVNDGSKDISIDEIEKLLGSFQGLRFTLVNQTNLGVSTARNNGVLNSRGELVAFVDSDDVWHPAKIESQVSAIRDKHLEAIACSYVIFQDSNDRIIQKVNPDWTSRGVHDWLLLRSYGGLLSSTLMLTRAAFEKAGPFDPELSLSADIEFALRLIKVCPVSLLELPLVGYRLRSNQMHHQQTLLESESKKMLKKVPYFEIAQNSDIYLANLNLRLALYQIVEKKFAKGIYSLVIAMRFNLSECITTITRITLNRWKRKSVNNLQFDSFLIQSSHIQSKQ